MIVVLGFILIVLVVAAFVAPALAGRRDVTLYGSIVDFNRRLSNIAILRTSAPSLRIPAAAIWNEPSVIGTPPPTVRLIGPDGRPIEPPSGDNDSQRASTSSSGSGRSPHGSPLVSVSSGIVSARPVPSQPTNIRPGALGSASASPQTLRRRKMVFQTLLGAFAASFVVGLLPGLRVVLLVSLVCALLLGAYVAMLRKIKLQSSVLSGRPHSNQFG